MNDMDESMRRLGGILKNPALALHYGHTTPSAERAFLRRLGLDKRQAAEFLEALCAHGFLDDGVEVVLRRFAMPPADAARGLLTGELSWPDE